VINGGGEEKKKDRICFEKRGLISLDLSFTVKYAEKKL